MVARTLNNISSIGPQGGSLEKMGLNHKVTVNFPANAVRKKIKVGIQVHNPVLTDESELKLTSLGAKVIN